MDKWGEGGEGASCGETWRDMERLVERHGEKVLL